MKKVRFLAAILALTLVIALLPASVSAVSGSDYCWQYTPQMTENTFRYLDEMYIQKYPEMGLRWTQGTDQDKQVLQKLADIITADCGTDKEKAEAIAGWIGRNIEYYEGSADFYAIDVFYARKGNCASYAQLMQTLLRLEGIPAVWGDGFTMDTRSVTVEQMQSMSSGHAWCFAYVDGQWALYDPLWEGSTGVTDRDYIAQNYFLDTVDQIVPAYDSSSLPPFRDPSAAHVYVDGRFVYYKDGQQLSEPGVGGGGVMVNLTGNYDFDVCTYVAGDPNGTEGFRYLEDPQRYEDMVVGELFRDGWGTYCDLSLTYYYENGVTAHGITMEYGGERYFMSFNNGHRLFVDEGDYYIEDGFFYLEPGYAGKIFEPYWYTEYENDDEYEITWSSDDPDIATVDQNGVITSTGKEGGARIWVQLRWKGGAGIQSRDALEVCFYKDDRVADYTDYIPHTCEYAVKETVEATCTSGGYTVYACSCGNEYKDGQTAALGHSFGDWVTQREPTADHDGLKIRVCQRCQHQESQTLYYTPPGHTCDYQVERVVEPSCEHEGYTVYKCSCGNTYTDGHKASFGGHTYGEWFVAEMPTDTQEGVLIRICSRCDSCDMQILQPGTDVSGYPMEPGEYPGISDHTCQWQTVEVVEASCLEDGFTIYACMLCGQEKADDFTAGSHRFGDWEVLEEPGDDHEGFRVRFCEFCGDVEENVIPAIGAGEEQPPEMVKPENPVPSTPTQQQPVTQPQQTVTPQETTGDPETAAPIEGTTPEQTDGTEETPGEGTLLEGGHGVSVLLPMEDREQLAGIGLVVSEFSDGEAEQVATVIEQLAGKAEKVKAFDIYLADADGAAVQPEGFVTVSIPVPESWNIERLRVYHVEDGSTITDMEATVSGDSKYVQFRTDHFSCYALAQMAVEKTEPAVSPLPWIILGVAAILALAIGGYLYWTKVIRKKEN